MGGEEETRLRGGVMRPRDEEKVVEHDPGGITELFKRKWGRED